MGTPLDSDTKPGLPPELTIRRPERDAREDVATKPLSLTPEQRREVLGKLVDFEMKLSQLPPKQANFVLAVIQDPTSWGRAARHAGYVHADVMASKLRHMPLVQAAIALGENLREDRTFVTSDRTLHEFAIIAFSDITNFVIGTNGEIGVKEGVPAYMTRAIHSVKFDTESWTDEDGVVHTHTKTQLRMWSKTEALKMLAQYQKLVQADFIPPGAGTAVQVNVHFQSVAGKSKSGALPAAGPVITVPEP